MSIVEDNVGNLLICVRLPVNIEQAEKLLRGTNKSQVINELDSKLRQLSEKTKSDLQEEISKLESQGFIINEKKVS